MKSAAQHLHSNQTRRSNVEREFDPKATGPQGGPPQQAAPQLQAGANRTQNMLSLQRSVGNRAANRLLAQGPKPAATRISRSPSSQPVIQRYHQLKEIDDNDNLTVGKNFAGLKNNKGVRVAEDGSAVVPDGSHWFYATPKATQVANEKLAATKSAITLEIADSKPFGLLKRLSDLGHNPDPLVRTEPKPSPAYGEDTGIEPFKVKEGKPGYETHSVKEMCLAFPNSCRMTARAILTGNPKSATRGVFKTPDGEAETGPHGASESDAEWALFGRDVRYHLAPQLFELAELPGAEQERIAELQDQALEDALGAVYLMMPEEKQKQFDALAGINASADAKIGEAFIGAKDHDLINQDERNKIPADSPRGHWGAVVMEAATDRVTLEGLRLQAVGSTLQSLHNRLWSFGMYGTKASVPDQTWNHTWGGKGKTSMVVRGSEDAVEPGVIDYHTPIKKREEADAKAREMEAKLPELIREVRDYLTEAKPYTDEEIKKALIAANYDAVDAYIALNK